MIGFIEHNINIRLCAFDDIKTITNIDNTTQQIVSLIICVIF